MSKTPYYLLLTLILCAVYLLFASTALAALLVFSSNTNFLITSPPVTFTVAAGSVADLLVVNATSVMVTISGSTGGSFTLTSTSTDISVSASGGGGTFPQSCVGGVASTTITQTTGSATYTIAPASSPCIITISFLVNGPNFSVPAFFTPAPTSSLAVNTAATSSPGTAAVSVSSTTAMMSQLAVLNAKLASLQAQLASVSPSLTPVFTHNLGLWSTGSDVKNLQLFLISENSGPAVRKLKSHGATTIFGILTYNALVEFQKKAGIIPASGYFGPKTRAYVNALE